MKLYIVIYLSLLSAFGEAGSYRSVNSDEAIRTQFHESDSVLTFEYCFRGRCEPMGRGRYSMDDLIEQEVAAQKNGYKKRGLCAWALRAGGTLLLCTVPLVGVANPVAVPLAVGGWLLHYLAGGVIYSSMRGGAVSLATLLSAGQSNVRKTGKYPALLKALSKGDEFYVEEFHRFKSELEALLMLM